MEVKIGQKYKIKADTCYHSFPIGSLVEITEKFKENSWRAKIGYKTRCVKSDDIEEPLVFGKKYKIYAQIMNHAFRMGTIVTIGERTDRGNYAATDDTGTFYYIDPEDVCEYSAKLEKGDWAQIVGFNPLDARATFNIKNKTQEDCERKSGVGAIVHIDSDLEYIGEMEYKGSTSMHHGKGNMYSMGVYLKKLDNYNPEVSNDSEYPI